MRKIIDGKVYDTKTSTAVWSRDNGLYSNDFNYKSTDLFKTKKGAFFVANYFYLNDDNFIYTLENTNSVIKFLEKHRVEIDETIADLTGIKFENIEG